LNNATSSSKEQEQEQGTQTDICSPGHLPACNEHCRAAQVTNKKGSRIFDMASTTTTNYYYYYYYYYRYYCG